MLSMRVEWRPGPHNSHEGDSPRASRADDDVSPATNTTIAAPTTITGINANGGATTAAATMNVGDSAGGGLPTEWLISGSDDNIVRVWDTEVWELVASLAGHTAEVLSLCSIGDLIVSGGGDGDHSECL